jgi:hypothetical protein
VLVPEAAVPISVRAELVLPAAAAAVRVVVG